MNEIKVRGLKWNLKKVRVSFAFQPLKIIIYIKGVIKIL